MSIVPVSSLSNHELALLGNNVRGEACRDRRELRETREMRAVNRSLALHDEAVVRLHTPLAWPLARVAMRRPARAAA